MEEVNIEEIKLAPFIKTRNDQSKVLLITFKNRSIPEYVDIPGEATATRVYPYMARPIKCFNCLQYGHTKKRCNKPQRCQNCTQERHERENGSNESACLYCRENHMAGRKECPTQIKEKDILNIENKYKVGKARARQLYEGISDNYYRNERE